MAFSDKLSRFVARWVKPADAARVISKQAAEKQARARLTLAERKALVNAELAAYVERQRAGA